MKETPQFPASKSCATSNVMLTYNTHLKQLVLPEYGRNIHRMVEYCVGIEDRNERNVCAQSIIKVMGNLFPELRAPENEHKLWDHLMIMSEFRLDIDFPCEVIKADDLESRPEKVPYVQGPVRFRHYGKLIQQMVAKVMEMPEGPERSELELLLANHMKKQMLAVNPDGVEDGRVFADLRTLSDRGICLDDSVRLHEFKEIPQPTGKKRKKKTTNLI